MSNHETDYLIVGAGAVGLAFADTLLTETADTRITIVDRNGKPGGHWNDAYSFVTLHQPSAFYGVNSLPLGAGEIDQQGSNAGLFELASGAEVSGYFDRVVGRRLLPSGRVRYLPLCDHLGEGRVRSLLTGNEFQVTVTSRLVDATYYNTSVPSTHRRKFEVEDGVRIVPPNALPQLARSSAGAPSRFVIVGAGKTAMDVAMWLLNSGVPADGISWIMPRDSWLLNRNKLQPGSQFFEETIGGQADLVEAFANASCAEDLFDRMEAAKLVLRIDPSVRPSMFHHATISEREAESLRTIADVIRNGRVKSIRSGKLTFCDGEVRMPPAALYVDCTASAVERRPPVPVFQPGKIVCQLIRGPHPTFSAALSAYVEVNYADDEAKNALCSVAPFPDTPREYPKNALVNLLNEGAWRSDEALRRWIRSSRLNGYGKIVEAVLPDDRPKQEILARLKAAGPLAVANLRRLSA